MRVLLTPELYEHVDPIDAAISFWRSVFHPGKAKPRRGEFEATSLVLEVLEGEAHDIMYVKYPRVGVYLTYSAPLVLRMTCKYEECGSCPPISKIFKLDITATCVEIENNNQ